ncbi:SDR family NAD(P)-dependent oxidoreductase [Longispora sp. K20-0274]|uniref:SDR family NAD(P)-dependent oxidoreductase n=1 Tax=Longispora sp. K20-0274 TaxID=3088255 RepID=UPI0039996BA9
MSQPVSPTALVTGASDGIGYDTARRLAVGGWNVIVHAPTADSAEEAVMRLVRDGADPLRLEIVVADFSRIDDVVAMAAQVIATHSRIDALVNNAAIAGPESRTVGPDGNELTFQVNYLAPYLLTRLLAGTLDAAPSGRVVNVSSSLHVSGNLDWADLNREHRYAPLAAYAQSKLALTMFTVALAGHEAHKFTAVSVHPGVVDSGLLPLYSRVGAPVGDAGTVVAQLASPETEVVNGAYYDGLGARRAAGLAENPRAVSRLWKISGRLTGLEHPVALRQAA